MTILYHNNNIQNIKINYFVHRVPSCTAFLPPPLCVAMLFLMISAAKGGVFSFPRWPYEFIAEKSFVQSLLSLLL